MNRILVVFVVVLLVAPTTTTATSSLQAELDGKDAHERATIKGQAITDIGTVPRDNGVRYH